MPINCNEIASKIALFAIFFLISDYKLKVLKKEIFLRECLKPSWEISLKKNSKVYYTKLRENIEFLEIWNYLPNTSGKITI